MSQRLLAVLLSVVALSGALAAVPSPSMAAPVAALTVVDLAVACGGSPRAPFADRPNGPAGDAVDCVARFGITSGDANGRYQPGSAVSRAQMASFLFRIGNAAGAGLSAPELPRFRDVDPASTHARAIDAVAAGGIASGQADGA